MINFYRAQIDFQTIFDHVNQYFDCILKIEMDKILIPNNMHSVYIMPIVTHCIWFIIFCWNVCMAIGE